MRKASGSRRYACQIVATGGDHFDRQNLSAQSFALAPRSRHIDHAVDVWGIRFGAANPDIFSLIALPIDDHIVRLTHLLTGMIVGNHLLGPHQFVATAYLYSFLHVTVQLCRRRVWLEGVGKNACPLKLPLLHKAQ